jgi:hypothetical protein
MEKNTVTGIVVVAIIAVVIAYYAGQGSNNAVQPVSTSQTTVASPVETPTPAPTPTQAAPAQPSATAPSSNADESRACAQQALSAVNTLKAEWNSNGVPGADTLSYENHYNSTQGKCFLLTYDVGTYNGNYVTTRNLTDAYDNTTIASYYLESTETNPSTNVREECFINNVVCTIQQFRTFLNVEMESSGH